MHDTAYAIGQEFFAAYLTGRPVKILEIGSLDVNGALRGVAPAGASYTGVDLAAGPGVDLVLADPHVLPFADGHFDGVVSSSCFEHDGMFWLTFLEMARVTKDGGYIYLSAPSNGGYHRYPADNWRFYPDSAQALATWARRQGHDVDLIESFVARRGIAEWNDCVMIFGKGGRSDLRPSGRVVDRFSDSYNIRHSAAADIENFSAATEDMILLAEERRRCQALAARSSPLVPFTTHGTVMYVDPTSGELRHGAFDRVPANVKFLSDGTFGQFMYEAAGRLRPIQCSKERCRTIESMPAIDGSSATTMFDVVRLEDGRVGLKFGSVFLCAEHDGRVTLSRSVCAAWESFLISGLPAAPAQTPSTGRTQRSRPGVSISCVENRDAMIDKAVAAVESTARCVEADCVYWFSDRVFPRQIDGVEIVNVSIPGRFDSFIDDINRIYLGLMPRVVTTDFNLVVQWDGFATNESAWDVDFLEYDYIGACWPWMWGGSTERASPIVGNGGFSLRSRKLYQAILDIGVTWNPDDWSSDDRLGCREYYAVDRHGKKVLPEDILICLWYRQRLEQEYGIRFCPPELANKFSVETVDSFTRPWLGRSFGFHGVMAAPHYGVVL